MSLQRDLVERARDGDHPAFTALAHELGPRLFALALRVTRNRPMAEDAVQEALIDAWRDLPGLRDPDRFEPWLLRILVRRCHRELRRSRRVPESPADEWREPGLAGPEEGMALRDEMARAFDRLTPDQRTVLTLRYHLDLEPAEIAGVLGIPAGTARSRIHYAMDALKAALSAVERGASR